MATNAQSIQFLLSQVRRAAGSLEDGTVTAYAAGTSNLKTIWLDRGKQTEAANPYTLDANGTAQLFGDGLYRFVIKSASGTTVYDRDYISIKEVTGIALDASDYPSLAAAVAAIGSTKATLQYGSDLTVATNVTIPPTLELAPSNGAAISINSGCTLINNGPSNNLEFTGAGNVVLNGSAIYNGATFGNAGTVTVNGAFYAGSYQVFTGGGAVTFTIGTRRAAWLGVSASATAAANFAAITKVKAAFPSGSTVIWPVGTLLVNDEVTVTQNNMRWVSEGGAQTYFYTNVGGTAFKQTNTAKRVLNINADSMTVEGVTFDGNSTLIDTVLVSSPSTGQVRFQDCTFTGCSATDPTKAALNIDGLSAISAQIYNCQIVNNAGNGLRLGNISNVTDIRGGNVSNCATAGTAGTAGIVGDTGNNSSIDGTTIEENGKAGTTAGGILINNAARIRIRVACENNHNYHIKTNGAFAAEIDIFDSYFFTTGATTTAIVLDDGATNVRIRGNRSTGHTNFLSVLSSANRLRAFDNNTDDTNYFLQKKFDYTALRNWDIKDLTATGQNMVQGTPPANWTTTLAGTSKWESSTAVKFNSYPTVLIYKDGSNNAYAEYTLAISDSSNNFLRGKWVTASFWAATADATPRDISYSLTNAGGTVSTATANFPAGASYGWTKFGGSIYVDPAATSITFRISGITAGYNVYAGNIVLTTGIDTSKM